MMGRRLLWIFATNWSNRIGLSHNNRWIVNNNHVATISRGVSSHADDSNILKSGIPDVQIPNVSISDLIMEKAHTYSDRVAMVDYATGRQHTYQQLARNMENIATSLSQRGLQTNDVMCIYSSNCVDYVQLMMGTFYAGGIVTTINPTYTLGEVLYQLHDAKPKFFACHEDTSKISKEACKQYGQMQEMFVFGKDPDLTSFEDILSGNPNHSSCLPKSSVNVKDDVVLLPYSSGTTGRAKGVMLTHHNLVANLHQYNNEVTDLDIPGGEQETYILVLPIYHLYGIFVVMLQALFKGHRLIIMSKFDCAAFMNCVGKYKATMLHIVPPIAIAMSNHPDRKSYDFSSVHTVISAAAPMGKELEEDFRHATQIQNVVQVYGLTETSPVVTAPPQNESKHGSVGVVVPNCQCKVVDIKTGKTLPANSEGELYIRGPQVMKGYLNNPKATNDAIDCEGWFHTGDVAYFDEDGHCYIVDRLKELIKYKAFQVAPAELEALLLTHPSVSDVAVIGIPDDKAGEIPRAFVTPKPNTNVTEEELKLFVAENLAPYKQLRGGVEFLEAVPKSPSGKILRRVLRERVRKG